MSLSIVIQCYVHIASTLSIVTSQWISLEMSLPIMMPQWGIPSTVVTHCDACYIEIMLYKKVDALSTTFSYTNT